MRTFTPKSSPILHTLARSSEAGQYLFDQCAAMPSGSFSMIPVTEAPVFRPRVKDEPTPLAGGHLDVAGICPATDRPIRLFVFRDASCVILRASQDDTSEEIFPETFALNLMTAAREDADMDYADRVFHMRHLCLRQHPDGLSFAFQTGLAQGSTVQDDQPRELAEAALRRALQDAAGQVAAAPALSDPREVSDPRPGERFAHFCPTPPDQDVAAELARLKPYFEAALVDLRDPEPDMARISVTMARELPSSPWRSKSPPLELYCTAKIKNLNKRLRRILSDPDVGMPQAMRMSTAMDSAQVILEVPASAHQKMERMTLRCDIEHLLT